MSTLPVAADERVADVGFNNDEVMVRLKDGRTISVPLAWYPRLLRATPEQRNNWRVAGGGYGIHWPDIDEDLSTEGLLRGAPSPEVRRVALSKGEQTKKRGSRRQKPMGLQLKADRGPSSGL